MIEVPRSFRYIGDPACVVSLILYTINRYFLKPYHIGGWFTHGYLNDVLCLPLFVPIILYAQHLIGLRKHFGFPRYWEIFQNWVVFAVVFQVVVPRFPKTFIAAGDPYDILAYLAGGIVAGFYWRCYGFEDRAARHVNDRGLVQEATARSQRAKAAEAGYSNVKKAMAALEQAPSNADANLVVGLP